VAAWKEVTAAVHDKGSFIWCQLWALGRTANPDALAQEGGRLLSSSAVPSEPGKPVPAAMTEDEIWGFVDDYRNAAALAIEAGFDGVEIHGANGYLVDQFTQDVCNQRTDAWGGSDEKRARFGLEVAKAVVGAVGPERTGIRLSPFSAFQGMKMADPLPGFSVLIQGLKELGLAYLHLVESRVEGSWDTKVREKVDFFVELWDGTSPVFLAGGYTPDLARTVVDEVFKDKDAAIVFGRYFISNPDLPFKVKESIPLLPYNRDTFYTAKSTKGYIDYPFTKEFETARI
jgi:NADPH2 dehydrogenase